MSVARRDLGRCWYEFLQLRKNGLRAVRERCRTAKEGKDLAFSHSLLRRGERLLHGDLFTLEVTLDQFIVDLRDVLGKHLGVFVDGRLILVRDIDFVVLARLRALPVHVALL